MSAPASDWGNWLKTLTGVAAIAFVCSAASALKAKDPTPLPEQAAHAGSDESESIIFERQQIMLQLGRDSELLGKIVAGMVPPDKLAEVTRSIAQGANDSVASFSKNVPGGRTKPEAWSNNADFTERMKAFARNADTMARAGQSGNVAGVTAVMIDALPCKQCHDVYRAPKKTS